MKGFSGFPAGKQEIVMIPALFFSELLPQIDHLAELQVTLYCFWALQAQEGQHRYVRFGELRADEQLLSALKTAPHEDVQTVLQDALERAAARGTLLQVRVDLAHGGENFYFMNTAKGRESLEQIMNGAWLPDAALRPVALIHARPNVYTEYEQNIGMVTPMIADQLQDLAQTYPAEWLSEAIKIAAENQKRHLSYLTAILARWQQEGRTDPKVRPTGPDFKTEFANLFDK